MNTCRADGLEPSHMKNNDDYLFDTLETCCRKHFPWKESCAVPKPIDCSNRYSYMGETVFDQFL